MSKDKTKQADESSDKLDLAKIKEAIRECITDDDLLSKDVVLLPNCYCVYIADDTAKRVSSYYPIVSVGDEWYVVLPLPPQPTDVIAPCNKDAYPKPAPGEEGEEGEE